MSSPLTDDRLSTGRRAFRLRDLNKGHDHFVLRQSEGDPQKERIRSRVVRFLADEHFNHQRPRFFGMPGLTWACENELHNRIPHASFVGIERDWSILTRGLWAMPGNRRSFREFTTKIGTVQGYNSESSKILWMTAKAFFGLTAREIGNKRSRERWRTVSGYWSGAWLDFMSPLCPELMLCLRRCPRNFDLKSNRVPIALTYMRARESGVYGQLVREGADRARLALLGLGYRAARGDWPWQPHLQERIPYVSGRGCPMETLLILMKK